MVGNLYVSSFYCHRNTAQKVLCLKAREEEQREKTLIELKFNSWIKSPVFVWNVMLLLLVLLISEATSSCWTSSGAVIAPILMAKGQRGVGKVTHSSRTSLLA